MRINRFIASATGISRRRVDELLRLGQITVNGQVAKIGQEVQSSDNINIAGKPVSSDTPSLTIMLNKPAGYVVSRDGQGAPTVYELLTKEYQKLKPIGRLDKDSSGLLMFTSDGELSYKLTHPKYQKEKVYEITLNKELTPEDEKQLIKGVDLEDGLSKLGILREDGRLKVTLKEGRNRQIRRTFSALGYRVTKLHRIKFGPYAIGKLPEGKTEVVLTNV